MITAGDIIIMALPVAFLAGIGWGIGRIMGIDIYTRFITRDRS